MKIFLIVTGIIAFLSSCKKVDDLPLYSTGTKITIAASATNLAPLFADADKNIITLSWTNPHYATASANVKYVVEIDSAGKDFSSPYLSKTVNGAEVLNASFTAKELNTVLINRGYPFNVPVSLDVRVSSSYANNNDRYVSDILRIKYSPYKVPPKVALPTTLRLFITGDATDFGWTNPSTMPAVRELTRIDETTWGGIFHLKGTGGYVLLPLAGDWGNKFNIPNGGVAGVADGGVFGLNQGNDNFSGAVSGGDGWYKLILDFQQGKFIVSKVANPLSPDLYITGDATASSWTNSPPANQKFTQITNGVFEITVPLLGSGKYYKFLSSNGNWQPQFGGKSATGGNLGANYGGGSDPDGIPAPAAAGSYIIRVNFITGTYTVQ